jgi:plastocyanin
VGAGRRAPLLAIALLAGAPVAGAGPVVAVSDTAGQPVAEAVVYLEAASGAPPAGKARHEVDQRSKRFEPRVSAIQAGTTVSFPNSDNIRHHVYSFSPAKVFSLKLYSGRAAEPVTFDQPGIVALGCNIHDQMVAWIVVTPGPWFATTGSDGRAALPDVPAGTYTLVAWHPSLAGPVSVPGVAVAAGATDLPTVTIPAGPVPLPVPAPGS